MTFGLRCSEPACRPHPASLPVRVPSVESLPPASFGFPLTARPYGSATVAVIGPDWLLSSNKILPMLGTLRAGPPGPALRSINKQPADGGVGRGPGGPPHFVPECRSDSSRLIGLGLNTTVMRRLRCLFAHIAGRPPNQCYNTDSPHGLAQSANPRSARFSQAWH